jgi:hypothetical protein
MLPYFNAGVIAVQNGLNFAPVWEECCKLIDAEESITDKRPWLDQFALSVALLKLQLPHHCLEERFNYPVHLKPLPTVPHLSPVLCHYHWPAVIRREPQLNQLVNELANTYPVLKQRLQQSPEWATLLSPYAFAKSPRRFFAWSGRGKTTYTYPRPEAIITGIPRSGTSYLCRLLHLIENCVVINEPIPIYPPLTQHYYPWQVATYYQEVRRDILDGIPVENKVSETGQVIEDTAVFDERSRYLPKVNRPDFLVATKNTLAYLARLPHLKRVMPDAPIIACVRHPLDTIASWKTTFPHLKEARVTEFPVGHVNDPFLSHWQHQRLAEIAATPRDSIKRALLWRYLAECVLMSAHYLILVRYEQLVAEPKTVLRSILPEIPHAPPFYTAEKLSPSTLRQKREVLDEEDVQAVWDIGGPWARELGYTM